MVVIGAAYAKKSNNAEEYFLGGRSLGGFVAALSAQASDMSGWLLMGLPGAIFLTGLCGDGWVAVGLLLGTICSWLFVASRLREYTIKANNSALPNTGIEDTMPVTIMIVVLGISAVYAYKKIQDYKSI